MAKYLHSWETLDLYAVIRKKGNQRDQAGAQNFQVIPGTFKADGTLMRFLATCRQTAPT